MSAQRRLLEEMMLQRLRSALDSDALLKLQFELTEILDRAAGEGDNVERLARRTERMLRRVWRRYGDEVVLSFGEMTHATLPAAG
jgi:hypothetical protein